MKIKSFLYNKESDETIALAYKAVSAIAKQLNIKLKSENDFKQRMSYGILRAKQNRWLNENREITSIKVTTGISYYAPWSSSTRESLEYSITHELTDAAVSDIGLCKELLPYASAVKIIVDINYSQAWRRQAKQKQKLSLSSLKDKISGTPSQG